MQGLKRLPFGSSTSPYYLSCPERAIIKKTNQSKGSRSRNDVGYLDILLICLTWRHGLRSFRNFRLVIFGFGNPCTNVGSRFHRFRVP